MLKDIRRIFTRLQSWQGYYVDDYLDIHDIDGGDVRVISIDRQGDIWVIVEGERIPIQNIFDRRCEAEYSVQVTLEKRETPLRLKRLEEMF